MDSTSVAPKYVPPLPRVLKALAARFVPILLCVLFATGCKDNDSTAEIGSPKEMGEKLNASLPKGTPLQTAKEYMMKQGFSCEPKQDAKWKNKTHVNYLHCMREDGTPPIKRLWEAAIIHDGNNVIVVDLRSALVYP